MYARSCRKCDSSYDTNVSRETPFLICRHGLKSMNRRERVNLNVGNHVTTQSELLNGKMRFYIVDGFYRVSYSTGITNETVAEITYEFFKPQNALEYILKSHSTGFLLAILLLKLITKKNRRVGELTVSYRFVFLTLSADTFFFIRPQRSPPCGT